MKLSKFLFFCVYLIFPFYIFPSGGFQFSSLFLLLVSVALIITGNQIVLGKRTGYCAFFIVYTICLNTIWFVVTSETEFIQFIAINYFSLFTFIVADSIGRHFTSDEGIKIIYFVAASIGIQLFIVVFDLGRAGYRTLAFFNNPNQLGYYCALSSATVMYVAHFFKVRSLAPVLVVVAAFVLSIFSLSKAAMIACLLYLIFLFVLGSSFSIPKKITIGLCLIVGVWFMADEIQNSEFYVKLDKRVGNFYSDNDSSLESRGYHRIVEFPQYLVFGAGEGYEIRFGKDMELHSLPATILFSYGVIGFSLYSAFLLNIIRGWREWLYLVPLLIYNLTHNGGRVTLLWMLLGLISAMRAIEDNKKSA